MFALQVKTLHHVFPTKIYTLLRSDDMHIASRCNGNGLFVTSGCVVDMVTRALLIPIIIHDSIHRPAHLAHSVG